MSNAGKFKKAMAKYQREKIKASLEFDITPSVQFDPDAYGFKSVQARSIYNMYIDTKEGGIILPKRGFKPPRPENRSESRDI